MNLESRQPSDNPQISTEGEVTEPLPRFAENMLEIGRIVSNFGGEHPGYPLNLIRKLDSSPDKTQGFGAEVYLEPSDDPQIVLNKYGDRIPGMISYRYEHLEISYRPDTKTSLRIHNKAEFPQSEGFKKPTSPLPPGNIFVDHGESLFLWMRAEFLDPNIVRFLDDITAQGLSDLQVQASIKFPQLRGAGHAETII